MAHSRHLALEDLRLARDPDHLLALFRKLAYRVEPELVPLDPANLEFPERAGVGLDGGRRREDDHRRRAAAGPGSGISHPRRGAALARNTILTFGETDDPPSYRMS